MDWCKKLDAAIVALERRPYTIRYYQETDLCILSLTTYDKDDIRYGTWCPLKMMLTFWLSQIRNETVQAVPEDGESLWKNGLRYFQGIGIIMPCGSSLHTRGLC